MAGEIGWWNRISSKEKRKNMFAIHCLCMKQRSQRYKKMGLKELSFQTSCSFQKQWERTSGQTEPTPPEEEIR
jgi:hypothetical protein